MKQFFAALILLAPSVSASEFTKIPEPLVVESGKLTVMQDGTSSYVTSKSEVQTQVHRVAINSLGDIACEKWNLEGGNQALLRGPSVCEEIYGEDASRVLGLAAEARAGSQSVSGPAWICENHAVLRLEEYEICEVTVTEYDGEGGSNETTRTFSFHELDYQACIKWCSTHWQEVDEPLGDSIMECGGGHDVGNHPRYVPPSER